MFFLYKKIPTKYYQKKGFKKRLVKGNRISLKKKY